MKIKLKSCELSFERIYKTYEMWVMWRRPKVIFNELNLDSFQNSEAWVVSAVFI